MTTKPIIKRGYYELRYDEQIKKWSTIFFKGEYYIGNLHECWAVIFDTDRGIGVSFERFYGNGKINYIYLDNDSLSLLKLIKQSIKLNQP